MQERIEADLKAAEQLTAEVSSVLDEIIKLREREWNYLTDGHTPFARMIAEAQLREDVAREFDGVKSNAEQREAAFIKRLSTDLEYMGVRERCIRVATELANLENKLGFKKAMLELKLTEVKVLGAYRD
jgi:Asp-tRNA(Asn)/Glu-tRNA(Gln) amidotransferase C subunit